MELNTCHFGDVRAVLRQMIDAGVKVQTIVTSPPYWALRSYLPDGAAEKTHEIGSEPTLQAFLDTMVEVFALAREVLADDGTAWVNMGDSYANRPNGPASANATALHGDRAHKWKNLNGTRSKGTGTLKHKDLTGQPWRLAFALQDDGWYLRQGIVWNKPNPMPESTRDRCTNAHEYVFLLTKQSSYFYDFDAMQEPVSGTANPRRAKVKAPDGWATHEGGHGAFHRDGREKGATKDRKLADTGVGVKNNGSMDEALADMRDMRNRRSVWTIPSERYSEAHFATFPSALVEPCVLAGSREGDTVLDIFMGSGTTALVARDLGRNWLGIDLDQRNHALQQKRLRELGQRSQARRQHGLGL